jgi:hypothetical protein
MEGFVNVSSAFVSAMFAEHEANRRSLECGRNDDFDGEKRANEDLLRAQAERRAAFADQDKTD